MHCKKKVQDYKEDISLLWIVMCTEEPYGYHTYNYYFGNLQVI